MIWILTITGTIGCLELKDLNQVTKVNTARNETHVPKITSSQDRSLLLPKMQAIKLIIAKTRQTSTKPCSRN